MLENSGKAWKVCGTNSMNMEALVEGQPAANRESSAFPSFSASWFHLCSSNQLRQQPVALKLNGRSLVAYRTQSGRISVFSGHCSHLAANLANAAVKGERLVCPLHGWEY